MLNQKTNEPSFSTTTMGIVVQVYDYNNQCCYTYAAGTPVTLCSVMVCSGMYWFVVVCSGMGGMGGMNSYRPLTVEGSELKPSQTLNIFSWRQNSVGINDKFCLACCNNYELSLPVLL